MTTASRKNTGVHYELLAKAVFEHIVRKAIPDVRTLRVTHNKKVQGKTSRHQIDVYWTFEIGGIKYHTVTQTKDWNSTIKQGHLIEFKGVLDDLPHQPRGIYVTRRGYQRGALRFAQANGIELYLLRPAAPSQPVNISTIGFARMQYKNVPVTPLNPVGAILETIAYEPRFATFELNVRRNTQTEPEGAPCLPMPPPGQLVCNLRDARLFDRVGTSLGTLLELAWTLLRPVSSQPAPYIFALNHRLADATFLEVPGSSQRLQIQGLSISGHFEESGRRIGAFDIEDVVRYVLARIGSNAQDVYRVRVVEKTPTLIDV